MAIIVAAVAVIGVAATALTLVRSHRPTNAIGRALPIGSTPDTPTGYSAYLDQTDRFAIAVPNGWRAVDTSSAAAAAAYEQNANLNANLNGGIDPGITNLAKAGMKFLALSPSSTDSTEVGINVIVKYSSAFHHIDLTQLASQLSSQYSAEGATVTGSGQVTLASNPALRVSLEIAVNTPSTVTVEETQYFLLHADRAYVITMIGSSPDFAQIANTFRVT